MEEFGQQHTRRRGLTRAVGTAEDHYLFHAIPLRRLQRLLPALLRQSLLHHRTMRLRRRRRGRVTDPLRVAARPGAFHCTGALGRALLVCALFLGALLLVGAFQVDARAQRLFHQVRALAQRAFLGHRLVIRRKAALGIIRAAPEDIASPRLTLGQVALPAPGTLHAFNQVLLHVLALGIAGARDELPEGALAEHQRLFANGAVLARRQRHVLFLLLLLAQLADGLAGRIFAVPRAGHIGPEEPAPQHHHAPAVIAVLFRLARLLSLLRIQVRLARVVLLGKPAARLVLLVVCRTRIKRAELAPLQQQRRPAQIAGFLGPLLHPLDVFHVLTGILEFIL